MDNINSFIRDKQITDIEFIDCKNLVGIPSFVDSHTHTIFAGNRSDEFNLRIKGVSYLEISKQGGGINSTVKITRETSKQQLKETALERINEMIEYGTGIVEIKSGYGLNLESEIKIV